jgi:hypothetical protein
MEAAALHRLTQGAAAGHGRRPFEAETISRRQRLASTREDVEWKASPI